MIYLFIATLCFSFSFGLIKSQISGLPVDNVVFFRLLFAGMFFLPFFISNIKKIKFNSLITAGIIGIIQYGIMYACFLRAFKYLQGNEIVLLTASTPIFVIIFSSFFTKKTDFKNFICVFLVIIGAIIVASGTTSPKFLIKGVIYMELSNITFALGQILWKNYIKEPTENLISISYLSAAICVIPFVFFNANPNFSPTTTQWLAILYLGLVPTGIGFCLWNKGAKEVSGNLLAVMNNLKIPFGAFFAFAIFKENTNILTFLIGITLIFFAIFYSYKINKNKIL